ncbi:MAG TPA: dockerin type I domain-containing protein [Acidobacteriota bacterium]|nr:dockerin type I domain-containing protein [Acidobacteriota bacterium]
MSIIILIGTVFLLLTSYMALHTIYNIQNVSAVSVSSPSLGVYWDVKATSPISAINWGNVTIGLEKDVTVFVKNLGQSALILSFTTSAWNPSTVYPNMYLCWNYNLQQVQPGSIVKVILKLFATPRVNSVKSFSFNLYVGTGLNKSPDVNGDGVINILDLTTLTRLYQTKAGDFKYNYLCDFNNDGIVNMLDVTILTSAYGS